MSARTFQVQMDEEAITVEATSFAEAIAKALRYRLDGDEIPGENDEEFISGVNVIYEGPVIR